MNWIKSKYFHFYSSLSQKGLYGFSLILIGMCLIVLYKNPDQNIVLIGGVITLQLPVFFKFDKISRFEYALVSLLTYPIGVLMSTILLGAVYYLVFTPIGLLRNRKNKPGWTKSTVEIDPSKLYD